MLPSKCHHNSSGLWLTCSVLVLLFLNALLPSAVATGEANQNDSSSSTSSSSTSTTTRRSGLSARFAMEGPTMTYESSSGYIQMEYSTGSWVTKDHLTYTILPFDCNATKAGIDDDDDDEAKDDEENDQPLADGEEPDQETIDKEETKKLLTELREIVQFQSMEKISATDDDISDGTANNDIQHWRLSLQINSNDVLSKDSEMDDDSDDSSSSASPLQFCVLWSLHSLPTSHKHSTPVTFRQSQLAVEFIDSKDEIELITMTEPEAIGVQVIVHGGPPPAATNDNTTGWGLVVGWYETRVEPWATNLWKKSTNWFSEDDSTPAASEGEHSSSEL